jgi:hypothetical protein
LTTGWTGTGTACRGMVRGRSGSFRVKVYAGVDAITGKPHHLRETARTSAEAEKVRTRLLSAVDERRAPRSQATLGMLIDRWLEVADVEEHAPRLPVEGRDAHPADPRAHQAVQGRRRAAGDVLCEAPAMPRAVRRPPAGRP